MRIPLNLASEPFRRDRPILAASAALAVVLTLLLGVLIYLIGADRARLSDTRAQVSRLTRDLQSITSEQARLDATLRQNGNAAILEQNVFLNTLVNRKSVSWTRIFSDLEGVMPLNVRLIQVRLPQVDSQNQVLLDMVVGAQTPGPVIDFLKRLQGSPRFGPATVHNSAPPTDNEPLYRYRVSVNYTQKL